MRRFTPEEDEHLIELRLAHCGTREDGGIGIIAKKLNRHPKSIWNRLRLLAEDREPIRWRNWTDEEIAAVRTMHAQGINLTEIGRRLGRHRDAVRRQLNKESK